MSLPNKSLSSRSMGQILARPTACGELEEELAETIDLIITSPPYNTNHSYGEFADDLSPGMYWETMKGVLAGSHRILKKQGLCVVDVAESFRWRGSSEPARDKFVQFAKQAKLHLVREYKYQSYVDFGDKHVTGHDRQHSDIQCVLVFAKTSESIEKLPRHSPFSERYQFGRGNRDEAYWPTDLVDDFISAFDLSNKVVLDPFMGSGVLGLRAEKRGCAFIGYDISKDLCGEFEKLRNFEFGADFDFLQESLFTELKAFVPPVKTYYIGAAVVDNAGHVFHRHVDHYVTSDQQTEAVERRERFKAALIDAPCLITQSLLDRSQTDSRIVGPVCLVSRLDGKTDIVVVRNRKYSVNSFAKEFNLTMDERRTLEIHFRLLYRECRHSFFAFFPIEYVRPFGLATLTYLTVCGSKYSDRLPHAYRALYVRQFMRSGIDVVSRRLNTTAAEAATLAIRAAAAAIMARNLSHNIGSHVTPRTRLEDLRTRVRELILPRPWWEGYDWHTVVYPAVAQLKDALDEYIQRMAEFIAEFSTDPRISNRSASFFQELMLPFMCNTALIDTLAANEGFRYLKFDEPALVIRCFRKKGYSSANTTYEEFIPRFRTEQESGDVLKWDDSVRGAPYALRHPEEPGEELTSENFTIPDIRLALPGPVGEMALYSILVNIVRNAAKHGRRPVSVAGEPRRLEIHITIDPGKPEHPNCLINIYDSLSEPNQDVAKKLNTWIQSPIVEPDGQCRKDAWGLAEMRLCADLLGGLMPGESHEVNLWVPEEGFERAVVPFLNGQQPKCLSCSLKIPKARTALFYGWLESSDRQRTALARNGYLICDHEKPISAAKLEDTNVAQFAVLEARLISVETDWPDLQRALPPRLVVVGKRLGNQHSVTQYAVSNEQPLLGEGSSRSHAKLAFWLWEKWLHHLTLDRGRMAKDEKMMIDMFLQQEQLIEPTQTLSRKATEYNRTCSGDSIPAVIRVWGTEDQNLTCFTETAKIGNHRLIVDRHGIFVSESGYSPQVADRVFWIDKQNRDFDLLFNQARTDEEAWTLPYELAEAGLLRVLIIDERILQEAVKPFAANGAGRAGAVRALTGHEGIAPLSWHVAERAGVYLVTHLDITISEREPLRTFDIARQQWTSVLEQSEDKPELRLKMTFFKDSTKIENFSAHRWPASYRSDGCDMEWQAGGFPLNIAEDIDVAVVHQGVIDRIKNEFKGVNDVGVRFLKALSNSCTLIIESGRGIPPEVQSSNERFLPFSSIERAFHGGRVAKLFLTRTILETTRRRSA